MKKSKLMIIALILGFSLLVMPIVSASYISFPAGGYDRSSISDINIWSYRSLLNKNNEDQLQLDIVHEDGLINWHINEPGVTVGTTNVMTPFTLAKPKLQYHLSGLN